MDLDAAVPRLPPHPLLVLATLAALLAGAARVALRAADGGPQRTDGVATANAACDAPGVAQAVHVGRGVVRYWGALSVTIAHAPIGALHWPAGVRDFAPPAASAVALAEGTPMRFGVCERSWRLRWVEPQAVPDASAR